MCQPPRAHSHASRTRNPNNKPIPHPHTPPNAPMCKQALTHSRKTTLYSQRRGTSSRARYLQQLDKGEDSPQVIARPHRGDVPLILLFLPRGDTARHAQPHGGFKLDDVRRSEVVRIRSWAIEHLDCCIRRHSHLHPRPWRTFLKQIKGISHRHSHRTTSQRRRDPHA